VAPDRSVAELVALTRSLAEHREQLDRIASAYSLLAGATRLKILALLESAGELCVCDLATILEMTPAAVSQHLSRLKSGDMVAARRDGMTIFYRRIEGAGGQPLALPDLCPERAKRRVK